MRLKNIDFKQPLRILIGGESYFCNRNISGSEHAYNQSTSSFNLTNCYPASANPSRLDLVEPFKFKPYEFVEIYFGDEVFEFGVILNQSNVELSPFKKKTIDITVSSFKAMLMHGFFDMNIFNKTLTEVLADLISYLNSPKIVLGTLAFETNQKIASYNTKDMTPYQVLKLIESFSGAFLHIDTNDSGQLVINYHTKNTILDSQVGNFGVNMEFDTHEEMKDFNNLYQIDNWQSQENNSTNTNAIRIRADKTISTLTRTETFNFASVEDTKSLIFNLGEYESAIFTDDSDLSGNRVIAITSSEETAGKFGDISYTVGSSTIAINEKLVGTNNKIEFTYKPQLAQTIEFIDSQSVADVASRTSTNGELTSFEQHNDLSNTSDILAVGNRKKQIGVEEKNELLIRSHYPIWNVGEATKFKYPSQDESILNGTYIVQSVDVNIIGDTEKANTYSYTLTKSSSLDTVTNFYDDISYRKDPIFDTAEIIDVLETINANITITVTPIEVECLDSKYAGTLAGKLAMKISQWTTPPKYTVWKENDDVS